MDSNIVVAVLALFGSLTGSYWSNRKQYALIEYRLAQVEQKLDSQDNGKEIVKLRERVTALEAAAKKDS